MGAVVRNVHALTRWSKMTQELPERLRDEAYRTQFRHHPDRLVRESEDVSPAKARAES